VKKWNRGYFGEIKEIQGDFSEKEEIQLFQPKAEKQSGDGERLEELEAKLLEDIAEHPTAGVAERFKRLNITPHRGYKLLSSLLSSGLVKSSFIPTPKRRVGFCSLARRLKTS